VSLKSILAVLHGNAEARRSLDFAALLASTYAAHLEVLHVGSGGPVDLLEFLTEFPPDYRQEAHAILVARRPDREELAWALFEEICRRHGFVHSDHAQGAASVTAHWHPILGDAASAIAERGRVFDLIVLDPRGGSAGGPLDRSLHGALFGTARPVLLANTDAPSGLFRRPLVAWNRGMLSARALGAALPLLERAQEAVIVYAETQAKPGPQPEDAADYLGRHGVRAQIMRLAVGRHSIGETLLRTARDINADLLVTGAAYHSRVRDLLFGGVTGHVLKHAAIPVLMAH